MISVSMAFRRVDSGSIRKFWILWVCLSATLENSSISLFGMISNSDSVGGGSRSPKASIRGAVRPALVFAAGGGRRTVDADDVAWAIPERLAAATAAAIGEDVVPPEPDHGVGWNPAALAGVDCSAMMLSVMLMMMYSGAGSRNASIAAPVIVFAVVVVAQRA